MAADGQRGASEAAAPGASAVLVSPSAGQVLYGSVLVRAAVAPPAGARISRVDLLVDGSPLKSLYTPPFEARWDAGEDLASHRFEVLAVFSDGTTASDRITTRGLRTVQHELVEGTPIESVELLVSVTDSRGAPVRGLGRGSFRVRDGGEPVRIDGFRRLNERENIPLSIAVLVDRSGSMRLAMEDWREASFRLIDSLRSVDQVRVAAFSAETTILQDFTRDRLSLAGSIGRLGAAGGETHLFRAVHETVRDLRDLPGRKAVFVLTDGLDTEYTSYSSPKTIHWYPILVETARMAVRSGITIIVILPRPVGSRDYLAIQDLALQTGGWYMLPSDDLGSLFTRLGERLLGSYLLSYDVPRPKDPDRKRSVEVSLEGDADPGWRVHSALSAYAGIDPMEALRGDLEEGNEDQRARAVREIARLDPDRSLEVALETLQDRSPRVRIAALDLLGEIRDPSTLEAIVERLHDAIPIVREAARRAAARFGDAAIAPQEKRARRRSGARGPALRALGEIGDPAVAPVLYEGARAWRCQVRAAAAEGLGSLLWRNGGALPPETIPEGSPEPGRILREALASDCGEESDSAALALGRLGAGESFDRLHSMAVSGQTDRRPGEAFLALLNLVDAGEPPGSGGTGEEAPRPVTRREQLRQAAAGTVVWLLTEDGRRWLGGLDAAATSALLAGLEDCGTDASILRLLGS
jgi:VWFA-related protein